MLIRANRWWACSTAVGSPRSRTTARMTALHRSMNTASARSPCGMCSSTASAAQEPHHQQQQPTERADDCDERQQQAGGLALVVPPGEDREVALGRGDDAAVEGAEQRVDRDHEQEEAVPVDAEPVDDVRRQHQVDRERRELGQHRPAAGPQDARHRGARWGRRLRWGEVVRHSDLSAVWRRLLCPHALYVTIVGTCHLGPPPKR